MAGVRGDVISLGFMQTTVMEMGQPPPAQSDPPAQWVNARQYTGRVVRVTNDKIFDSPVYNCTREFPYALKESIELEPRVYWRLTDNWLELTVRFIAEERGVRGLKDRISRDILAAFDEAGLGFASTTYEIVGLPPVRFVKDGSSADHA